MKMKKWRIKKSLQLVYQKVKKNEIRKRIKKLKKPKNRKIQSNNHLDKQEVVAALQEAANQLSVQKI